jgi:hypothetical protein
MQRLGSEVKFTLSAAYKGAVAVIAINAVMFAIEMAAGVIADPRRSRQMRSDLPAIPRLQPQPVRDRHAARLAVRARCLGASWR